MRPARAQTATTPQAEDSSLPSGAVNVSVAVGGASQGSSPAAYETEISLMPRTLSTRGAGASQIHRPFQIPVGNTTAPPRHFRSSPREAGGRWKAPGRRSGVDHKRKGACKII